ncbi:zinc finger protein 75D [Sigmodon hispidus]
MSEVKEDGCFTAHMKSVQESNLSMRDNLNQNRNDSSQTEGHPPESAQQHFRNFCYNQVPGPLVVANKLRELCYQWLMPETNSKEQILEALVLEQFLSILPQEMKNWVQKHHPQDVKQAVALVQCLQKEPDDAVPNECHVHGAAEANREATRLIQGTSHIWSGVRRRPLLNGIHPEVIWLDKQEITLASGNVSGTMNVALILHTSS